MRKENQSLWEVRHLWTSLYGDATWLPCETMIGPEDADLYTKDLVPAHAAEVAAKEHKPAVNGDAPKTEDADVTMTDSNEANNDANKPEGGDGEAPFIHPMYLPPPNVKPDRDMGLPDKEADDIRMLIALYVQKQEEVCRGTERLHEGLLRAERLRAEVLRWSKAEAHCGPNRDLSDGEDWYDKEEWGLTEDLKKGHDEEEEETTTQAKTRRARR